MFREIQGVRQDDPFTTRRWFQDDYFDLWTWHGEDEGIVAFQLCYDKRQDERALTWREGHGFDHLRVQTGRDEYSTAFLEGPAGVFPALIVSRKLKVAGEALPTALRRFLFRKVKSYVRGDDELR